MIPNAAFVPAVALQTKFSLSRKLSRNLGSMLKMSAHVLSITKNDRVPREKLWGCCGNTVLTAACYCPSSHCISARNTGDRGMIGGIDPLLSQNGGKCAFS